MKRQILRFVGLAALVAFLAPGPVASASSPAVAKLATKVAISSVKLLPSGCGVEVNCIEVNWSVQSPPANPQVMTFEVSGTLTTQNGSCNANPVQIGDHNARSAKVGFFQGGSCTGQVKSANMTVKLFTRDIEGQKVLTSTANKNQTF